MTPIEYRRARTGDRVRARRVLSNAYVVIPAGTVLTVTGKRSGFKLLGDGCCACGLQPRITRVHADDVEVVSELEVPPC